MHSSSAATPAKPSFTDILGKVIEQVESGKIKLPMEDKLTMRRLVREDAFELAYEMRAVEIEAIAHMATGNIWGRDNKDAYPDYMTAPSNTTARQETDKLLVKLDNDHVSLGLIKGEQSKRQYVAELDKAAQCFVEANYSNRPR